VTVANVGLQTALSANAPAGTYYIRVVALNAFGTSAPSNEVRLVVGGQETGLFQGRLAASEVATAYGQTAVVADIDGNVGAITYDPGTSLPSRATFKLRNGGSLTMQARSDGLPARAVVGDSIILFDNYTATTVDLAIVNPGNQVTYVRGAPRGAQPRPVGDLAADAVLDNRFLGIKLQHWGYIVSSALCIPALPSALTMAPFAASVLITGCGAAIVGMVNSWQQLRWGAQEEGQLVASRDNASALADTVQCGTALSRGVSGLWECIGLGASVAIDLADKYLTSIDENAIRQQMQARSPNGISGVWNGTWTARSFGVGRVTEISYGFREQGQTITVYDLAGTVGPAGGKLLEGFRVTCSGNSCVTDPDGTSVYLVRVDGRNCEMWYVHQNGATLTGRGWYNCGGLGALGVPIADVSLQFVRP
jgi:hypothetical protein